MKRLPLVASFLLFVALCASIAYWGLQLFKPPLRPVAAPPRAVQAEVRPEAASALFGPRAGNVAVASNYQLRGVIFAGTARDSIAILSADGKPAQAVRVNSELLPGVTVKEVHREYVLLSEGGTTKRVELPESAKAQGGVSTTAATVPGRSQPSSPSRPAVPAPQAPVGQSQPPAVVAVPPTSRPQPQPSPATPQPGVPQPALPAVPPPPTAAPPVTMTAPPAVVTNQPPATQYVPPPALVPAPNAPTTTIVPSTLPSDPATAPLQSR